MSEQQYYYVPLSALSTELKDLIPPGDKVIYTSKATIFKKGFGGDRKYGYLALTDKGVAFRASKMGFATASIMSAVKGALEAYVPYASIARFENKEKKVKIKHTIPDKPGDLRSWELAVERCKDYGETDSTFGARKKQFGAIFQELMKRTGK